MGLLATGGATLSTSPHLPRCSDVSEHLSEFLDDELDADARHEVALHLALCGACAQLALELAATVHALHGLHDPDRDAGARRTVHH